MNLEQTQAEIIQEYKNLSSRNDKEINRISNKILDIFDAEYAKMLRENKQENVELEQFIMKFVNGKFKKQLKMNILTNMSFLVRTNMTKNIIRNTREKVFKQNIT